MSNLPALRTAPLPPVRQPATSTAQLTVLPAARAKAPVLWIAVGAMVTANLILYVLTVVQEASLNHLQTEILAQRQQNIRLRAELASQQSPDRIETAAASLLSMVRSEQALYLPPLPPDHPVHHVKPPVFGAREAY